MITAKLTRAALQVVGLDDPALEAEIGVSCTRYGRQVLVQGDRKAMLSLRDSYKARMGTGWDQPLWYARAAKAAAEAINEALTKGLHEHQADLNAWAAKRTAKRAAPRPVDYVGAWLASLTEYVVPPTFVEDCWSCECEVGFYVRRHGRRYVVACTAEEVGELMDRARYYTDPCGPGDSVPHIRTSAYATIRALQGQGVQ